MNLAIQQNIFDFTRVMCYTLSQPQIHKLCQNYKPVLDLGCIDNIFPFMEGL